MTTIAERLKTERNQLGMTQEAFGNAMGVSLRTQQNYENGVRSPDSNYLKALHTYGVDAHYVITGEKYKITDFKNDLNLILDAYEVISEKLGNKKLDEKKKRELAFALYELYKETDSKSEKLADTVLKLVVNE